MREIIFMVRQMLKPVACKLNKFSTQVFYIAATAGLFSNICLSAAYATETLITINQFVSHPALDQAKAGVEEALKNRGLYPDRVSIKFDNAQGNIAMSTQIAKHQASLQPAFMVAIATPAAQSSLKAAPKTTIVAFTAVSDPQAAGLTEALNVIGVADSPPLEELLDTV